MFKSLQELFQHISNKRLLNSVKYGSREDIRKALENGGDMHAWNGEALESAIARRELAIVELLIAYGANVNAGNGACLRVAADHGRNDIILLLLKHGADIHGGGDAALRHATYRRHVDTVRLLLAHDANARTNYDHLLYWSADTRSDPALAEIFEILAAHIFRPAAWQGKSAGEVEAELKKITQQIRLNNSLHYQYAGAADHIERSIDVLRSHAFVLFHKARRDQGMANPIKPRAAKPPKPL